MSSLVSAFCLTAKNGLLIFEKDVKLSNINDIKLQGQKGRIKESDKHLFAQHSGYYIHKKHLYFFLPKNQGLIEIPHENNLFFVVGPFNQWQKMMDWELRWKEKKQAWILKCPLALLPQKNFPFKFVSIFGQWIEPWSDYGYLQVDEQGNRNLQVRFECSGAHWLSFELKKELKTYEPCEVLYNNHSRAIDLLPWLSTFEPQHELGSIVKGAITYFGLFAPTVKAVWVELFKEGREHRKFPLELQADGVWTLKIVGNYENYCYYFIVENPDEEKIVDPYARQLLGPKGPGIITSFNPLIDFFKTHKKEDLVVLEAHVRDLTAHAAVPKNLSIFGQLQQYFLQKNYVKDLGINCIEFMPLTEYDTHSSADYHWGYMPAHYFALSSCYGTPEEFQACVKTLHDCNISVILDVVYNHAGVNNDLLKLNENYYFRHEKNGILTNVSGCGNDLRTESPAARKLILDSLLYFIDIFNVDGFRFDLAELLGVDTLNYLSKALKAHKPDIILIAEPWSFRGHIAYALRETDFSSWNDGFREFIFDYINGRGNCDGFKYFLEGSTAFLHETAQQSINYTESHDDYTWIDRLEDNDQKKRKTHCMFALLYLSLGIPMLCEGQDFLRSKGKVRNTYNRGDLNLLDYTQLKCAQDTHQWVKDLIAFRASRWGKLLKIKKFSSNYFRYFYSQNNSAMCVVYNADKSLGDRRILFAINPHPFVVEFELRNLNLNDFNLIATTDGFIKTSDKVSSFIHKEMLPPLSCEILIQENYQNPVKVFN